MQYSSPSKPELKFSQGSASFSMQGIFPVGSQVPPVSPGSTLEGWFPSTSSSVDEQANRNGIRARAATALVRIFIVVSPGAGARSVVQNGRSLKGYRSTG